jgi:cell division protein FtsW
MAYSIVRKQERIRDFKMGLLPHLMLLGVFSILLLLQPDMGTAVILTAIMFFMLFVAGGKLSYLVGLVVPVLLIGAVLIIKSPYRFKRVLAFLDPLSMENRRTIGYQIAESLMSVGSGGAFGLGLGEGRQKLFFLPAAHTDFVFAIMGEEFGFAGFCVIVMLFAAFVYSGYRIAVNASDRFGMYLAFGITSSIAVQAVVNMMVVVGLAPTKGLTLPFVSYGGSSVILTLFSVGILQSIHAMHGIPPPITQEDEERPSHAAGLAVQNRVAAIPVDSLKKVKKLVARGRNRRR